MLETIVPRLLDIHLKLCQFNSIPLKLKYPAEEMLKQETASSIISSCEELIKYGEAIEVSKLKIMIIDLQKILQNITKFKSFKCDCKDTMRFIQLNFKAREGFANKLPELEKAIQCTSTEVQKTIDSILDSHKDLKIWDMRLAMKVKIIRLMKVCRKQRIEYYKFEERFGRLSKYLQNKLEDDQRRSFYMDEVIDYLNGKSETFLSFLQETDSEFIRKSFGKHSTSDEVKQLLRNSLREVMIQRGVKLEEVEYESKKKIEQTEEQKKLHADLKIFFKDMIAVEENVVAFQNIEIPNGLKYLQQSQFNMQYYRKMLQQHQHLRL